MWVEKVRKYIKENVLFVLIGNKIDLLAEVSADEAQEKAQNFGMTYFEMNVTDNQLVNIFFEITTRLFISRQVVN